MLFQSVIDESLSDLEESYFQASAKAVAIEEKTAYVPFPPSSAPGGVQPSTADAKIKTRGKPQQFDVRVPTVQLLVAEAQPLRLKVKASTAAVFNTLPSKSQVRGSVSWTEFEAALTALGFSATPKGGSVFTYNPSVLVGSRRPITLHRPHKSEIEGWKLLIFGRRLNRVYGWDEDTCDEIWIVLFLVGSLSVLADVYRQLQTAKMFFDRRD